MRRETMERTLNAIVATIMAGAILSASGDDSCYQVITYTPCVEDVDMTLENGCIGREYHPAEQTYCDARDGEGGYTVCNEEQIEISYNLIYGQARPVPGDPTQNYCHFITSVGPIYTGDSCTKATQDGEECGTWY